MVVFGVFGGALGRQKSPRHGKPGRLADQPKNWGRNVHGVQMVCGVRGRVCYKRVSGTKKIVCVRL